MNKIIVRGILPLVIALGLWAGGGSGLSSAQEPPAAGNGPQPQTERHMLRVSDMLGREVRDDQGAEIGEIEDVVFAESGRVDYLVLNVGERMYPIPWGLFGQSAGGGDAPEWQVAADRQRLQQAPSFSAEQWRTMRKTEWMERVHSYFGATSQTPPGEPLKAPSGLRIVE
jgi:sporulation protein YlmC with PRC-barrel domain